MKEIETIKKKLNNKIFDELKDFDYVDYCGGEQWKPNRRILDKDGKEKWYYDSPKENKNFDPNKDSYEKMTGIEHMQEEAWMFCDTVIMEDNAEKNIHYIDYATNGERMGWKVGDEYWLVFNIAFNRLEIRKADPKKWTPLDKYFVSEKLELEIKIPNLVFYSPTRCRTKYIQKLGWNSFPDRIELHIRDADCSIYSLFEGLKRKSKTKENIEPFKKRLLNYELDSEFQSSLKEYKENTSYCRRYNLYKKDEVEDPKEYMKIFKNYNHNLWYRENKKAKNKK